MKKQLTARIKMERIGKRLEFAIQANRTYATLILVPLMFIAYVMVIFYFIEQRSEAPWWWALAMLITIPVIGILFSRQWLWEYRGFEYLSFDLLTETLTYRKEGSYWIGNNRTWSLNSLSNLQAKKRGVFEGNMKFSLPPFSTIKGETNGNSFQFGDTLKIEEAYLILLITRREGFIKGSQFLEGLPLENLTKNLLGE